MQGSFVARGNVVNVLESEAFSFLLLPSNRGLELDRDMLSSSTIMRLLPRLTACSSYESELVYGRFVLREAFHRPEVMQDKLVFHEFKDDSKMAQHL
jgi:hypothetical protein